MNKYKTLNIIILSTVISIICGCSSNASSRYDSGYSDGYAEGYNTECKIRATLVEGAWDDKDYSQGYQAGRVAGVADCRVRNSIKQ